MDRLARNTLETLHLVPDLDRRGVTLNAGGVIYEPHNPMGELFFTIMAAVAEAEGGWISLRTKVAMARPDVRARLKGKKPKLSPQQDAAILEQYEESEIPVPHLARSFNVSKASVYRALERAWRGWPRDVTQTRCCELPMIGEGHQPRRRSEVESVQTSYVEGSASIGQYGFETKAKLWDTPEYAGVEPLSSKVCSANWVRRFTWSQWSLKSGFPLLQQR